MKKSIHLIIIVALWLTSLCTYAQENTGRQIYNQAESEYNIGRIDQARQLILNHMSDFEGNLKQNAYRLLALCYLSEDQNEEARHYAEQLVRLNNYYNSNDDPARFQELIEQLKEGIASTITTASSQSESVNEAPVPITIITADMIEELGYNKNLGQILAAYVPGMSQLTSTESVDNLSMHGAFSLGQEFILIMENGHRLNNRFDNAGNTSYSISTEKIDHIEVLRGPASSLYGNVALSAVVNIITKSGKTSEGVKVKYGNANFKTHKADLTLSTQFMDADIFAWASIYKSDGQIRHFDDGNGYLRKAVTTEINTEFNDRKFFNPDSVYVERYKYTPAYDIGLMFKLKGFELLFSRKNVNRAKPMTPTYGGYDYDRYFLIDDIKPGNRADETHAELSYSRQFRNLFLTGTVYSDWYRLSQYEVYYDSLLKKSPIWDKDTYDYIYDQDGNLVYETSIETGNMDYDSYRENTMGGTLKASTSYQLGRMKGNALAGIQYERFSLLSRLILIGSFFGDIERGNVDFSDIVENGKERSLSLFFQDKTYILPQLILNAGFRYDFKYRHEEDVVRTFSPRLAMMYVPNERFSLKLSYSEAFADLSFYYRYLSKTPNYSMSPQHLSALQLTAMGTIPSLHTNYDVNLFYNKYTNLLWWFTRYNNNIFEEDILRNIGQLTNVGIEATARYAYKRLSANLSLYYCHDISAERYYYNKIEKKVNEVPHFTFSLHGAWKVLQNKKHEVKAYGHFSHIGKKLSYHVYHENEDFYVPAVSLIDLGVKYSYKQRLQLSVDCENIFNTDNYICGPNYQHVPHFQRGRTLMTAISYRF